MLLLVVVIHLCVAFVQVLRGLPVFSCHVYLFFLYQKPLAPVGFMDAKLDLPLACYLA